MIKNINSPIRTQQSLRPTYLYVKQHSVTGKLYFGKTYRPDVETYFGSGTEWTNHLRIHGKQVETLWFCLFTTKEDLKDFATKYSILEDIVNSDRWLNKVPESGLGGGSLKGKTGPNKGKTLAKHSESRRRKNSVAHKGISQPKVTCPHCGKIGGAGAMHQQHFDYCKLNPTPKIKSPSKNLGRKQSDEEKKIRSLSMIGVNKGKKGKPRSEETKNKLRKPKGKQKIVTCPVCLKEGGEASMRRWHFNNCKDSEQ